MANPDRNKILLFAKKCVEKNDEFHGMKHLKETADTAEWLAKAEGADAEICWAAAMLHDICKNEPGDHAVKGSKKARRFLLGVGTGKKFAEKVADAIYFHNKEFRRGSLERKILWDSDKLPLMLPKGFETRLVPYWIYKLGGKRGIERSIYEYYFYFKRFHTKTAKKEISGHLNETEKRIRILRNRIKKRKTA